jgi:dihydroceramidase
LPWGILLEGHGWWWVIIIKKLLFEANTVPRHIFTGIAAYLNITYGLWLHYCRNGRQDEVHLVWPSIFGSIPVIERKSNTNNKTHWNKEIDPDLIRIRLWFFARRLGQAEFDVS